MQTIEFAKPYENKICIALGYFDGVHLGHRTLISKVIELSAKHNAVPAISTFADSPNKKQSIYSYHDRKRLFSDCGIELCLTLYFAKISNMNGEDFFNELVSKYNVASIVCGEDYKFGCDSLNSSDLRKFCEQKSIEFAVMPLLDYGGVRVSSSAIKAFLLCGDMDSAAKQLSIPYHIRGEVIFGQGIGHRIGVPTANISLPYGAMDILRGVYGTYTEVDGIKYRSVTNVGGRPTFDQHKATIETHLMGYCGNSLLEKEIIIYFYKYIRPIRKYNSSDELVARIQKDKAWKEN